jgi:hypothetical protein
MALSSTQDVPINSSSAVIEPACKKVKPNPASDPAVYETQHKPFLSEGLSTTTAARISRARAVGQIFAFGATARDIENKSPEAEIALLESSGLLKSPGAQELQRWWRDMGDWL